MMMSAALLLAGALTGAAPCEGLKTLALSNATVVSAQQVPAGPFAVPAPQGPPGGPVTPQAGRGAGRGQGTAPPPAIMPAFCRVDLILTPSADSNIETEVWLPADTWNGKFQFVGGGGWAGVISYAAMVTAVQEGYATASTDTGHKGGNALFAIGHPEKLTDFAWRAVHESTVQAKALIDAFYGRAPRLSYWNGCSTGGRQGLMEAQKFPNDFDAIVAGAPANNQSHMHTWDLSEAAPVLRNPAAALTPAKLRLVNNAVMKACDAKDGLADGLIADPRACRFDPATLACHGADGDNCLTTPQVETVRHMYEPLTSASGQVVFPGKEPDSEPGWGFFVSGQPPAVSVGSFQVAYQNGDWDAKTFDVDRDLKAVDATIGRTVNATSPDLRAFKSRGGKLLLYHGWSDPAISPGNTIDYYESVLKSMGGKQDDFVRLFMAPGMQHCGGGEGPNQINWMGALERWREANQAPVKIEAAHVTGNRVDRTRPLCPYPQVATYSGTGSANDAANFVCR